MKPFKLQTVLDYRQTICDMAHQELCKILEQENKLIAIIKKERQELNGLYAELQEKQQAGIPSHELILYENSCSQKIEMIKQLEKKLQEVRQAVMAQRQIVCETDREKKLLEKLKEKQMTTYKLLLQKKENREMDEIAVQTHSR
jgi:flagellar FliJ protein